MEQNELFTYFGSLKVQDEGCVKDFFIVSHSDDDARRLLIGRSGTLYSCCKYEPVSLESALYRLHSGIPLKRLLHFSPDLTEEQIFDLDSLGVDGIEPALRPRTLMRSAVENASIVDYKAL